MKKKINNPYLILFVIIILNIYTIPFRVSGDDNHPNHIEDKDILLKPGDKWRESITDNFDTGTIYVQIVINKVYTNGSNTIGTCYYNITLLNIHVIKKEGYILNKVDFKFNYPNYDHFWELDLKNVGNTTLNLSIFMNRDMVNDWINIINIGTSIIICSVAIITILYLIYLKKKKQPR